VNITATHRPHVHVPWTPVVVVLVVLAAAATVLVLVDRPAPLTVSEQTVQVAPATAAVVVAVDLPPTTAMRRHLVEEHVASLAEARRLAAAHEAAYRDYVRGHNHAQLVR
jgi:hypothetical protein